MNFHRITTALGLVLTTALVGCGEGSDDPADGGTGGTSATGGSAQGNGTGGSGNETSSGGSGNETGDGGSATGGGSPTEVEGWTFDPGSEEWEAWNAAYSDPEELAVAAVLSLDTTEGDPDPGALSVEIPFEETQEGGEEGNQKIHIGVSTGVAAEGDPLDLTGRTVRARVRLVEGLTSDGENPGGAKLYVKSTDGSFIWADGGWESFVNNDWMPLSINLATPSHADAGFDPSDIVEIGIEVATSGSSTEGLQPATVLIDTVTY